MVACGNHERDSFSTGALRPQPSLYVGVDSMGERGVGNSYELAYLNTTSNISLNFDERSNLCCSSTFIHTPPPLLL